MIRSGLKLFSQALRQPFAKKSIGSRSLTSNLRAWFGEGGVCCGGKPGCKSNKMQSSTTDKPATDTSAHEHTESCGHHHHGEHISAKAHRTPAQEQHVHGPGCKHDHGATSNYNHNKSEPAEHVHGPGCNHDHDHDHHHDHKAVQIPKEVLTADTEVHKLGDKQVETTYTRSSVSLLDNIKGAKNHDRGELYVLMFTCSKCETKSIRSFTKVAYHEGVVLIRCEGCDNVHLIADNLGWFEDEKTNLESFAEVKKVVDPAAVTKILQYVFDKHDHHAPTQTPAEPSTTEKK